MKLQTAFLLTGVTGFVIGWQQGMTKPAFAQDSTQSAQVLDIPAFPTCEELLASGPGDHAHYGPGNMHQIVGGPLLSGSDDVYSLQNGNYVQCYCPDEGDEGIQTNWWRTTIESIQGWFREFGTVWNLGDHWYQAHNSSFSCNPETQPEEEVTPTPTLDPTPTPTEAPKNEVSTSTSSSNTSSGSTETKPNEVLSAYGYADTGVESNPSAWSVVALAAGLLSVAYGIYQRYSLKA